MKCVKRAHAMRCQGGFTLVEVLAASLIFIVGAALVGSVIGSVIEKNFLSLRHTQAVNLAQNKIEELLYEGYESVSLQDGSYSNPDNPINETADSSGVFYQYWQIDDVNPIERAKLIISRVEWDDADGERQMVYLTSVCIDETN